MALALDTVQLTHVLTNIGKTYKIKTGVFSYDQLPDSLLGPAGLIINSDISTESGEHWTSLYIDRDNKSTYLCSFGIEPYGRIYTFVKNNCWETRFNIKTLQNPFTNLCSFYCIFHILMRAQGFSLSDIVDIFNPNDPVENDAKIAQFVLTYINH